MHNYTSNMYGVYIMSEANDDCCSQCCVFCGQFTCSFFGILCCVKEMKRSLRVKLLWVYMSILGVALGIVTALVIFGPTIHDLTPGAMLYTEERLSSLFCSGVDISVKKGDFESFDETDVFSAYLFTGTPPIDKKNRRQFNQTLASFMEAESISSQKIHLLAGSSVFWRTCSESFGRVYIIKGAKNSKVFINSDCGDAPDGSLVDQYYFGRSCRGYYDSIHTFEVKETDVYGFVFKKYLIDDWVISNFDMRLTQYKTDNAIDSRDDTQTSGFEFDSMTTDYGVVVKRRYSEELSTTYYQASCVIRTWILIILYLIVPMILSIIGSCVIYKFCREHGNEYQSIPGDNCPVHIQDPQYVISPPKYEDIMRDSPPSYEDATNVK